MVSVLDKRKYWRDWYASHPEYRKRKVRLTAERRQRIREWLRAHKAERGCVDCNEHDPDVLDFDHRADKKYTLADHNATSLGLERVKQEVAKCDIRCANCHRRRTARTRGVAQSASVPALEAGGCPFESGLPDHV